VFNSDYIYQDVLLTTLIIAVSAVQNCMSSHSYIS